MSVLRRLGPRWRLRPFVALAAGAAMVAGLAFGTNWRLALLAAVAASAIALTRLRYAPLAAVGLLAVTVVIAETGHSAGSDHRDLPARGAHR